MLSLSQVTKRFGSTVAVDGLSLDLVRGEVFGLLGPNGAGKTTTVGLIVGLLSPDAGAITMADGSMSGVEARRRIGVAPQALSLYEELTGEENLSFLGRLYGLSGRALRGRVDSALAFVELADRRADRVKTYSGGMKRRLNLAASILHEPALLLLDEPTVGVDPQSRNAIFDRIVELREGGTTIVYTTHYMEEAQRLCDRVGIMDHGRLLAVDTVSNLVDAHGGRSIVRAQTDRGRIERETDDPVAELNRLQSEGELIRFHLDRPDLEAVFLALTGRRLRD